MSKMLQGVSGVSSIGSGQSSTRSQCKTSNTLPTLMAPLKATNNVVSRALSKVLQDTTSTSSAKSEEEGPSRIHAVTYKALPLSVGTALWKTADVKNLKFLYVLSGI